jgi:hypothetical protein
MSVTRLKRKHRKNIARANNKQHIIKELLRTPVLKNVDIEELKANFPKTGVAGAVAAVKETAAKAADKVKEVAAEVVEKVKEVVATDDTKANAEAFDDAEAVTKPVNEDGQEGEHPKPEIAL